MRFQCQVIVVIVSVLTFAMQAQELDCERSRTCASCVGLSGDCIWCSTPGLQRAHCMNESQNNLTCSPEDIVAPQGRIVNLTLGQNAIMEQFSPLAAELELRQGLPLSFLVEVTPTPDYPLDIYILMDSSNSMRLYIENLRAVSRNLADTLNSITADFRIGFGLFNEKPLYPYTVRMPGFEARSEYSFRHIVSLTEDIASFSDGIANFTTFANEDAPEALLEAVLQCAVCEQVIGWRSESRKLILAFTDEIYHIAGDGKWAGIFRPHDGNCYLSQNMMDNSFDYTMWRELDYPSIGQVQAKLQENDIILVLSSVMDKQEAYQNVVQQIPSSIFQSLGTRVQFGSRLDSDLFLNIIESSFNATSQRVELIPVTDSPNLHFTVKPTCPSGSSTNGSACSNVAIGRTASFNLSVTLRACPLQEQTVPIRIPGFGVIPLQLTGICRCACEEEKELNSSLCSMRGDHTCGVCVCYQQRFGERCQCETQEAVALPCPRGITRNSFCSGRGQCECGMCLCNQPSASIVPPDITNAAYYGDGCEFDNFSCPKGPNGLVCSGNGDCGREQACACSISSASGLPLRGEACQCPPAEEVCIDPQNRSSGVCSGRGECRISQNCSCLCGEGFHGQYCQSITMNQGSCVSSRVCVECEAGITSSDVDCASLNCSVTLIAQVEEEEYFINGLPAAECDFLDVNDCLRVYYIPNTGSTLGPIHLEETADCGGLAIPVWSIVVIIVGGLLLLGILLLILVKCILICLDNYEVHRWERERENQEFGISDNPLYTNPDQKYENVAYGRLSPTRTQPPFSLAVEKDEVPGMEDAQDIVLENIHYQSSKPGAH